MKIAQLVANHTKSGSTIVDGNNFTGRLRGSVAPNAAIRRGLCLSELGA
jgi:hypothetical protein